jgi:hypothetical protein
VKVLLDENLDHRLRKHLGSHEVFTASYMGWDGFKNGQLLRAAEDDGFAILVTGDQTLGYEQNLTGRRLAIVALSSVEWRIMQSYLPEIVDAIDGATPGSFRMVECGALPTENHRRVRSRSLSTRGKSSLLGWLVKLLVRPPAFIPNASVLTEYSIHRPAKR